MNELSEANFRKTWRWPWRSSQLEEVVFFHQVIWRSLLKVTEGNFILTDKKEEKNDHLKNSKNLKKITKTLSFEYENFWQNENTKRCPKMYIATTHTHKRQPSVKILLIKTILTFLHFLWYFYFGTYGMIFWQSRTPTQDITSSLWETQLEISTTINK